MGSTSIKLPRLFIMDYVYILVLRLRLSDTPGGVDTVYARPRHSSFDVAARVFVL